MNYLGSVIGVMLVNLWSNLTLKKRLKDLGFIEKVFKTKFSLANVITLIFLLTPGLNVAVAGLSAFFTIWAMKNDDIALAMFNKRCYSSKEVKKRYERDTVKEDVLRDALTIDGADEELIQEQFKQIEKQKHGYEEDPYKGFSFISPVPDFTDEEYLWASALEYAKLVVDAINLDVDLTDEERDKLLDLFEKECKAELMGKEKSGEKVMKKVLNIVE